jgi:predicted nucleotidyltransferase
VDPELEKLIAKAAEVLKELGATAVYVFGSATTGKLRRHSDIDLAVEGLPPEVFFRAIAKTSEILNRPVDLLDLARTDPLTQYIKRSGTLKNVG